MYITQPLLVSCIVRWYYSYIGYVFTLGGVYSSSLYATMSVGVGDFEYFLDIGAGVGRVLGSFTLGDTVVLGGLLYLTSTFICAVSLRGGYCGVVFGACRYLTIN